MNLTNKIVFVLVSDPSDHYTEMALLSIQCARKYSPCVSIELVMDRKTESSLSGYRGTIFELVDKVHVTDLLGKDNVFTSRMIKTQLRSIIDGDYLYIDIDAVPVNNLESIFTTKYDLAMVYDHNTTSDKFIFHDYEQEIFNEMHWDLPKRYFNSGVMFVKDSEKVRAFFEEWHKIWRLSSSGGLHKDQPPMHEAIRRTNIHVNNLKPEWNMLISLQKGAGAKNPKIYHYSTIRFDTRNDTYFHEIVKKIKIEERIEWELVDRVIKSKYPWTNTASLRLNWAVGNYVKLPRLILRKVLNKI